METRFVPTAAHNAAHLLRQGAITILRNRIWNRRLGAVMAAWGSLALIGVSGISFADDNDSVPVDGVTRDRLFEQILDLSIPGVDSLSVGLDPVGNKIGVTIFAPAGLPVVAIDRLKFGDNVTVDVVESEGPRPQADLAGGRPIMVVKPGGKVADCTTGFAVGFKGGRSGFLTAGHCFVANRPANLQPAVIKVGDDYVRMVGEEVNFEPSDWGTFVFYDSPSQDDVLPEVVSDNGVLPIEGIQEPTVGMPVCKHGVTTGTTCGTVRMLDVKVIYPAVKDASGNVTTPKTKVEGLVQTNACSEGGDSGGPVYTTSGGKTMAVGITSGGLLSPKLEECLEKVGKINVSYFVPLSATSAKSTDPAADVFLKVAS